MSYKNYRGPTLNCPNEPNFAIEMDWFAQSNTTGQMWEESVDDKNKFWNDIFSTQNNSINGYGCMWNYNYGGDAYVGVIASGYLYLGNVWGYNQYPYAGQVTVIPWSTQ